MTELSQCLGEITFAVHILDQKDLTDTNDLVSPSVAVTL
jgi:hypothetical protein